MSTSVPAIAMTEAALAASPSDNSIRNMLGRAHDAARNYPKARENYQKAADEGNLYALTNLAWYSIYGTDGAVDMAKGTRMFEQASNAGNPYAQASLGWLYREGYNGTRKDYGEAFKWYSKAAEQGYAKAQNNLAVLYAMGQGVPQDYKQAHAWFSVAAANGYSNATKGRDMAAAELTPAGKEEAQALASQYFEQYQPKQ